jgi:protein SCO1/2
MKRVSIVWAISFIFALSIFALAQSAAAPSKQTSLINDVRIEQKLDEQVPLDLKFRDETGREVTLRDYFGTKPVILSLVYYQCPMLCTLVLNGLTESLADLRFNVGEEFSVVTVSIDPTETSELAAEKKTTYLRRYGRAGAATGWHFLTGDEAAIKQLAQAVGFRYQYDPQTRQFAHASGITVLTPQGKVARYFYGIEYSPRDLRLGLVEASANQIGSPVDQVLLLCYHYDATTGKYTSVALNLMRGAGFVTVVILGTIIFALARASKKRTGSGSFTTTKMN